MSEKEEVMEVEVIDLQAELAVFDPVANAVADAKERCANIVLSYDTQDEIKEAKSFIYQIRKLKAPINEVHRLAKAEALKFTKALDNKKRELIGAVDEMIEEKYAPIKEIEDAETLRLAEEALAKQQAEEAAERERLAEIEAKERELAGREAKIEAEKQKLRQAEREKEIAENAARQAEANAKQALADAENRRLADVQRERDRAVAEAAEKEKMAESIRKADEAARLELEAQEQARITDKAHRLKIHTEIFEFLKSITADESVAKRIFLAIQANQVPLQIIY
jgi:hypothetical protein